MKIKATLILLISISGFAKEIKCYEDARPVDGIYEEIYLLKNEKQKYDLTKTIITPGFGSPVTKTVELLAKDMNCNIIDFSAYCFAERKTSAKKDRNTRVKFSVVKREGISSLTDLTTTNYPEYIEVSITSPLMEDYSNTFKFFKGKSFQNCIML